MQREADLRDVPISKIYTDYVSQIEVKAASLLQHISVMLALTSIYFATADAGLALRVFLTFEILAYLWAALACLRCLLQISTVQWMRGEEITIQEFDQAYSLEGLKREVIYRHAMQLLVVLTIMLAVAIVVHTIGVALQ